MGDRSLRPTLNPIHPNRLTKMLCPKMHLAHFQSGAKHLLTFFGDSKLSDIGPSNVERYVTWRSEVVQDGTIKRETGILSAAFNHAIQKHDWKVTNPCIAADLLSDSKGRVRFITKQEGCRLVKAARNPLSRKGDPFSEFNRSPFLADFIELALNTGCRNQELLGLKWPDVVLATRLLRLSHTNAGEWQTVPINEESRAVLLRRMQRRDQVSPNTPYVFFHELPRGKVEIGDSVGDIPKSFKNSCREAGIENFRIQDLRHTFASWLVMDGVSIFDVSKLLRHSSISMTERYAHRAPDHLHQTVANRGFSTHFQHTENSLKAVA